MFEHVPRYAGDPILSLVQTFLKDPRQNKVNLSIGFYYDAEGKVPVLDSVAQARDRIDVSAPAVYLPMEGDAQYRKAVQEAVFGADHPAIAEGRIATIHTLGGSGALKVGGDFLKAHFPGSELWISDPTWENHYNILGGAGFEMHAFPYYDAATNGLRFEEMLAALRQLPELGVVLLQPCCHNPTGIDPTREQWAQIADALAERNAIPFFDMAYQGFGDGLDEDAWIVREMARRGGAMLVGNSFSKSMSLYGERVGGLSVVCPTPDEAARVLGQLQATVRKNYSSPALFGSRVVGTLLNDPGLRAAWHGEVAQMRTRINAMRRGLRDRLQALRPDLDVDYFVTQRGMFSYTGLRPEQVDRLRDEFGVYLIQSGRMCVAGLFEANLDAVAQAMAKVMD
ncbi:Aromatic-amino-acid aminotransferase [Pigmentiphaga humi]|uniref:Aminotransferase n=1 Tax=Pigmentiphaga humi TaxID=2478468 RepID=A0A3P4AY29_9BURK|nr:amino acid aminotransferase [Pigmentiphaga humi]VCU68692.1 Aromatic-amino-acid aminotransferase [Pigmentiphaga humi]